MGAAGESRHLWGMTRSAPPQTPGSAPPAPERAGEGEAMHALARRLFPICRSLTGDGVRETLAVLAEHMPGLRLHEVPSGTRCFDWTVPDEWNLRRAVLTGPDGRVVADTAQSNLRVVGYSEPVDLRLDLEALQPHLHSLPEAPDWIPYVTSYYRRDWGFCLTQRERDALRPGEYHARIDSTLAPGALTYADLVIPGGSEEEVLISTYVCHPSLANNELSGPVVATWLARWAAAQPRRYTYRFVFVPETIGSILYLSRHLETLKARVKAGFVLTCLGDERAYSYMPSRLGGTAADRVALHVLKHRAPDFVPYSFLDRGSDERQYCSPGVDLPVCSVMRSKYGVYPEYHTSADDLELVTPAGLQGGYDALRDCLDALEADRPYRAVHPCEPQMGRRGLYSSLGTRTIAEAVKTRMDILAYADGRSLLDIAETLGRPIGELVPYVRELLAHDLIIEEPAP